MSHLYKTELKEGYNAIVKADDKFIRHIELGIVRLKKGGEFSKSFAGYEAALVILGGKCKITAGGKDFEVLGERKDVFSGCAFGLYLPPDTDFAITAVTDVVEVAIALAPSKKKGGVVLVRPDQVKKKSVGRDNWRRDVYDIIDSSLPAEKLVVGETINPPGNWSSYPPHKHDIDNLPQESDQEEVYFFRFQPPDGFGMIRLYTDDRSLDVAYPLKENDTIVIPEGYHPVAAGGGYRIYYLWILAGEKRVLAPNDDPRHKWIKGK